MATQAIGASAGRSFLQRVLQINVLITGLVGAVLLLFSAAVASDLGLNQQFIAIIGAIGVLAAAAVGWLLATGRATPTIVQVLASKEIAWALLSYASLAFGWLTPNALGWWVVAVQADVVLVFAALEFYATRRR